MFLRSARKWFLNWLRETDNDHVNWCEPKKVTSRTRLNEASLRDEDSLRSSALRFKVFPANGGVAIEVSQYDDRRDDMNHVLHVIPEDADLATELSNILVLQSLRK